MKFLLDANMPRAAQQVLLSSGHEAAHIRDTPLAGASDGLIAEHARSTGAALVTRDFDFADIRQYPPERYHGLVVLSVHDTTTAAAIGRLVAQIIADPKVLQAIAGNLVIAEFGRVRVRTPGTAEPGES